jgi:hypothetical protein
MPVRSPFAFVSRRFCAAIARPAPLVDSSLTLQFHAIAIARRRHVPEFRANDPTCCDRYRDS